MRSIELAGLPGSGKSTVAHHLIERLGLLDGFEAGAPLGRRETFGPAPLATTRSWLSPRRAERVLHAALARQRAVILSAERPCLFHEGPVHRAWQLEMAGTKVRPRTAADVVVFLAVERHVAQRRLRERPSKVGAVGTQLRDASVDDPVWDRADAAWRRIVDSVGAVVLDNTGEPSVVLDRVLELVSER